MKKVGSRMLFAVVFFLSVGLLLVLASPRLTVLVETRIIEAHRPVITGEAKTVARATTANDWQAVKLLSLCGVLKKAMGPSPEYSGALLIPSLDVNLPWANYTNDDVYTFGAGMLEPHYLNSNCHLVIGAHNLGQRESTALFTPLAFHKLTGRKVILTNFQVVKEYQIISKQVISPSDTRVPFQGGANSLVLLTCTSDNQKRILVRAKLVRSYPFKALNPQISREFHHKYKLTDGLAGAASSSATSPVKLKKHCRSKTR